MTTEPVYPYTLDQIKLYPNLSKQFVNVFWESNLLNGSVSLLDLNGQVAKSQTITGNIGKTKVDLTDIQNGVYYIKVSADDFESVKPLIIVR